MRPYSIDRSSTTNRLEKQLSFTTVPRYLAVAALAGTGLLLPLSGCSEKPQTGPRLEVVASGLELPWSLAFPPDGRILIAEKPGRIRVVADGELLDEPWATLDVVWRGASGLLGMTLGPDYEETRYVYVVGSFAVGHCRENRVIRFSDQGLKGTDPTILVDGLPASGTHSGAAVAFGPDGMMYVTVGDIGNPPASQDTSSLAAKILRYRPDGSIPDDNPIPGSPIYTIGNRNTQSLSWHPETGELFAPDQGPSVRAEEHFRGEEDELNVIFAGKNYGWPIMSGWKVWENGGEVERDDPRFVSPIMDWTGKDAIAPCGSAFYLGDYKPWKNNLFVAFLRSRHLRRVALERAPGTQTGWRVAHEEELFKIEIGRVRTVVMAPDGYLYITTDNRYAVNDMSGPTSWKAKLCATCKGPRVAGWPGTFPPLPGDDKVYRVVPEPQ